MQINNVAATKRAEKQYTQALIKLIGLQPLIGHPALKLKPVCVSNNPSVQTTCTDGKNLFYDAAAWIQQAPEHQLSAIAHQALTCGLLHPYRMKHRVACLWQDASDYVVNGLLQRMGFRLQPGALIDSRFDAKTIEEVYDILLKEQQQDSGDDGQPPDDNQDDTTQQNDQNDSSDDSAGGPGDQNDDNQDQGGQQGDQDQGGQQGGGGDSNDSGQPAAPNITGQGNSTLQGHFQPKSSQDADPEQQMEWRTIMAHAAQVEKNMGGAIDPRLAELLDELLKPKAPWPSILLRHMQDCRQDDYNWHRPDRRFLHTGLILPTMHMDNLPCIVAAMDTSRSMSTEEIRRSITELNFAKWSVNTDLLYALQFDTSVTDWQCYTRQQHIDDAPFQVIGRGGTNFDCVFRWIDDNRLMPSVIIIFSDMACEPPTIRVRHPVIWCSTHVKTQPKGFRGEFIYVGV